MNNDYLDEQLKQWARVGKFDDLSAKYALLCNFDQCYEISEMVCYCSGFYFFCGIPIKMAPNSEISEMKIIKLD